MALTRTPFDERMKCACELASVNSGRSLTSESLAREISARLSEQVSAGCVEAWMQGQALPSPTHRQALAEVLGFDGDFAKYLLSDDADVIASRHTQVETVLALVSAKTDLIALRRTRPLDEDARGALRRLA